MADPSGKKPSSPQRGSGSGSGGKGDGNDTEGKRTELTLTPAGDNNGDGSSIPPTVPPLALAPVTQPPVPQAQQSSGSRSMKKKGKTRMKAVKEITVRVPEEPGKKKFASLENLPGRARTCSICHREFPTARALFGHMRSHPDRLWRGAHPPPVSPRREEAVAKHGEDKQNVEQTQPALELAGNLLSIGENILRTTKFKGKEGEIQAGGRMNVGSSSGFFEKAGEATARQGGPSSGDIGKKKKKRNKKKKTKAVLDYTDEEQRKVIHSQIDLNKEASAEDDAGEEETPSTSD